MNKTAAIILAAGMRKRAGFGDMLSEIRDWMPGGLRWAPGYRIKSTGDDPRQPYRDAINEHIRKYNNATTDEGRNAAWGATEQRLTQIDQDRRSQIYADAMRNRPDVFNKVDHSSVAQHRQNYIKNGPAPQVQQKQVAQPAPQVDGPTKYKGRTYTVDMNGKQVTMGETAYRNWRQKQQQRVRADVPQAQIAFGGEPSRNTNTAVASARNRRRRTSGQARATRQRTSTATNTRVQTARNRRAGAQQIAKNTFRTGPASRGMQL